MDANVLFSMIGKGKDRTVKRPSDPIEDRKLRKMIEEAQKNVRIIINVGYGYYEPDLSKTDEVMELKLYVEQKDSRIRHMYKTTQAMRRALASIGQMSIEDMIYDS